MICARKSTTITMVFLTSFTTASCDDLYGSSSGSRSEADKAYDACQPSHNQRRNSLRQYWSLVSGVGADGSATCYWSEGNPSLPDAQNRALASCRARYTSCFEFSNSNGMSDWAQQMSDNLRRRRQGTGGGGGGGYTPTASDIQNVGAILGLGVALMGGGGGGGVYTGGGGGRNCQPFLQNANTCSQRYNNMASLPGTGTGVFTGTAGRPTNGGQTGAFNACYEQNMNAYRQCMAR